MKTSDYDTALALANITGRSIEDFYSGSATVVHSTASTNSSSEIDMEEVESVSDDTEHSAKLQELAKLYNGTIVNGKILGGRQMTRKEFLDAKKKINNIYEYYDSPLMNKMFRSEGQTEASFVTFVTKLEMELENE